MDIPPPQGQPKISDVSSKQSKKAVSVPRTNLLAKASPAEQSNGDKQAQATASNSCDSAKANAIGVAYMDSDGNIRLHLRRAGSIYADAQVTYKKEYAHYQEVLKHLGGMTPGDIKLVAPWPDGIAQQTDKANTASDSLQTKGN